MSNYHEEFTHFDEHGNAIMIDVSDKDITKRTASAEGTITVTRKVMDAIMGKKVVKGDVLTVAQVAGLNATKCTPTLIPLCHPLSLTNASVNFEVDEENCKIKVICEAITNARTGVEMEALIGVSVALLAIYDMCKAIDKQMLISDIHVIKKTGGIGGDFTYQE